MLTDQLGIRLVLLMGETVPLPAPHQVMSALIRAQVTSDADSQDGFELRFRLSKDEIADYGLLQGGRLQPFHRVILGLLVGAVPEVLIDGVITHQQFTPGEEPGSAVLTVMGKDISQMLDLEEKNRAFPNQPDFLIATQVIAEYARFGLVPLVSPTTDVPIFLKRIPRQHETDLGLLKRLARANGFVFYIEPFTLLVSKAYWGPENRLSIPQPALTMNMGSASNVKGLHFSNDGLATVAVEGSFVEPISGMTLPIPPIPPFKIPPLASAPAPARRKLLTRDTAHLNLTRAMLNAVSTVSGAPDPVRSEGELDMTRYGRVMRARKLIGVRGVGRTYSGNYYVRRVSHVVENGQYTQSFTLSREGTGTLVPVVRP
jgi:hypothetical protein